MKAFFPLPSEGSGFHLIMHNDSSVRDRYRKGTVKIIRYSINQWEAECTCIEVWKLYVWKSTVSFKHKAKPNVVSVLLLKAKM